MRGALLIILALCAAGCEESVNPVVEDGRPFSLYGFFDARSDTQAVRVYANNRYLDLLEAEPLDARLSAMDLTAGTAYALCDSIVRFATGRVGHVYWTRFRAPYGHRIRLEATRSDSARAWVEVAVPPLAEPVLRDPVVTSGYVLVPVAWLGAPRLNNIRVRYRTNRGSYLFRYPLDQTQSKTGSMVAIRMSNDARKIFRAVVDAGNRAASLRLRSVDVLVLVSNAGWEPPGEWYDPDALVEPGAFSNVENGFGFVGAGYEAEFSFEPPDSMAVAAGFFINGTGESGM